MKPSKKKREGPKEKEDAPRTGSHQIVPGKALMDAGMDPGQGARHRKDKDVRIHRGHQVLIVGDTRPEHKVLTVEAIHQEPRALTGAGQHMYNDHPMVIHRPDPL